MTMALSKGSLPLTPETPLLHCCQHTDQAADSARKNSCDKMCLYRCKKRRMLGDPRSTWCYGECMDYCYCARRVCIPI